MFKSYIMGRVTTFVILLVLAALAISANFAFANETNVRFGDRSWQFKTPSEKIIQRNDLLLYCQSNPSQCYNFYNGGNGSSSTSTATGGPGFSMGNDSIVGNNITIVVEGDGNVIEVTADQLSEGDQTINRTITDNDLDITVDNSTTTTNNSGSVTNNSSETTTTTTTNTYQVDDASSCMNCSHP